MELTTYEFYKNTYYGEDIEESAFPKWLSRATEKLHYLTYGNITEETYEEYTQPIQKAVCALMDMMFGTIIFGALGSIDERWYAVWDCMREGVIETWNGMWDSLREIINSIIEGIETMANAVISAVNGMIQAINNMSFSIPDWIPALGGKSFSLNLRTIDSINIPRLANGGITTGSTIANIGEAGREAVLPLENNLDYLDAFADKIAGKMGNAAGAVDLTVNLDGKTVYKRMVQLDREFAGRTGRSQFAY